MTITDFGKDFKKLEEDARSMWKKNKTILDQYRNERRKTVQSVQISSATDSQLLTPKGISPYDTSQAYLKSDAKSYTYIPNEKILRILQNSEEISGKYSAQYRNQSLNEEKIALSQNMPREMATLQKFMKESYAPAKGEHQKTFSVLDNQIESKVVSRENALLNTNKNLLGAYGSDQEQPITHVFTKFETKKVNPLQDIN